MPQVIAGPIVRKVTSTECHIWVVTSNADSPALNLSANEVVVSGNCQRETIRVGKYAFIHLLSFTSSEPFEDTARIGYSLSFSDDAQQASWENEQRGLLYDGQSSLCFHYTETPETILHGSCRKPHFHSDDALAQVDVLHKNAFKKQNDFPDLLLMTGDQIYADDVAGPMLKAIHSVIDRLGLYHEALEGAVVTNTNELATHEHGYYEREQLLPQIATNTVLSSIFFGAKKKPVFTSVNAQNHLIGSAEIIAMYLLVWSDTLWADINIDKDGIPPKYHVIFDKEHEALNGFVKQLPQVRRALAHIPTYMIFDDHDVTDDWNLTRGWEQEVYGNPLSKRMIGNALIGYLLCQGWGNAPKKVAPLIAKVQESMGESGLNSHDEIIDDLLDFDQWHYRLDTTPPIEVLDTRTQRWRSESNMNKPSGLMDWEALCDFQHSIIGKESVIVVSAAPIYGVKVIEAIQKVFTFFGKALTVDAENWMAHKGTANVILNIFRHYKTPPDFIILSGDVHYSFVYDVRLRFRRNSPHITQFTCSGLKNAFPDGLIKWLDRLNRVLYRSKSPLNLFTRRRNMSVKAREPSLGYGELFNGCAIGVLKISQKNTDVQCKALLSNGKEVEFPASKDD
ncbi:peptide methionine sulfoxide reductase [Alteromonas macleodii]|uniref:Peptide methionine sulfoxide reductase n=1 Tax=Alteromonas macleodii (strain English Channel 673) TaxID=1004788 RepID=A0AB33A2I3_ALTME|nr:peptide methionine sulfoxide reductase [Alteromonas macleodii]AFT75932.1 peptide methionine sulfoxide reductase [Alteromonas macleodii str. 'English Channel 673']MBL3812015.1 alkaline phosphatase family protein [Alteromonas macleodii]MBL3885640.1 alkaline phosphatase family protein [Alteromonas macleodii]